MIDFYPEFTNLCRETIRNGHQMEQAALSKCRLAIYSSEWAANSAIANYVVDSTKIKVVSYGANLTRFPSAEEVHQAIALRCSDRCKLLFVGVDWHRKGGDEALLLTSALNEKGVEAELRVVGCEPPTPIPSFVHRYGYLSKNDPNQNDLLYNLYKTSDFFVLPSKAECAAVAIAEANAFGLPALTTNVGGIGTVVRNGKNGRAFDPAGFVRGSADYILQTFSSMERYHELSMSSFEEYSKRLNWGSGVKSVLHLMGAAGLFP